MIIRENSWARSLSRPIPPGITSSISAASFCAIASAASAQVAVYPYPGEAPTVADTTGAPLYGYRQTAAQPATVGSCDIIAGNRVCTSGQMGASYGYGGPIGAVVGAPFAIVAAPFNAFGMTGTPVVSNTNAPDTGTPTYSYESHVPPQPGAVGHCDMISGNRICTMP